LQHLAQLESQLKRKISEESRRNFQAEMYQRKLKLCIILKPLFSSILPSRCVVIWGAEWSRTYKAYNKTLYSFDCALLLIQEK
jgi:hypothetical protein